MDRRLVLAVVALALEAGAGPRTAAGGLATTPADFVQPGTQPSAALNNFIPATPVCAGCHGGFVSADTEPNDGWAASLMAQSARDPIVRAAAAIAREDAASSGETCIRCHAPIGWLGGRSTGGDLASLEPDDLEGVGCHVCHRMLDPIGRADAPLEDAAILAALDGVGVRPGGRCRGGDGAACVADAECGADGPCDVEAGQGRFVVDPGDGRRGPFEIPFASHPTITSPFHRRADACAPCHDVSTPTYSREPGGGYVLNDLDAPHPTQQPGDMFPEQRTYSEWRASDFARGGVVFPDGRFGGALTATLPNAVPVATCQDCHMPDVQAAGCDVASPRPDLPAHWFPGANTWVLAAVHAEYGAASGLDGPAIAAAQDRVASLLAAASDLEATVVGTVLRVRVVNQTGHKLPTGYPEGRRMWLNVRFFAEDDPAPVAEDGAYDAATATLDVARTTKTYEVRQLVGPGIAAAVGLEAGTPFHLVLNDTIELDDRIPPRGFTTAAFAAAGAAPVGYAYADGQHWDDTDYPIPARATHAEVTLYYQTTTREYAEFLRDTAPDATGANAHARWEAAGRSAPAVMNRASVSLVPPCGPEADACCARPDGAACDDVDACTAADTCGGGACAGRLSGLDGVRCELSRLAGRGPCEEPLPRKLRRFVTARAGKAKRLVRAAERSAERRAKLLDRAARALAFVPKKAAAAAGARREKQRITLACSARVGAAATRARDLLRTLP